MSNKKGVQARGHSARHFAGIQAKSMLLFLEYPIRHKGPESGGAPVVEEGAVANLCGGVSGGGLQHGALKISERPIHCVGRKRLVKTRMVHLQHGPQQLLALGRPLEKQFGRRWQQRQPHLFFLIVMLLTYFYHFICIFLL